MESKKGEKPSGIAFQRENVLNISHCRSSSSSSQAPHYNVANPPNELRQSFTRPSITVVVSQQEHANALKSINRMNFHDFSLLFHRACVSLSCHLSCSRSIPPPSCREMCKHLNMSGRVLLRLRRRVSHMMR